MKLLVSKEVNLKVNTQKTEYNPQTVCDFGL
jgi:hypothetical protein